VTVDFDPDECVDDGGHCDHYGAGEDCCYCGEWVDDESET
jgi:hypothetical protein